MYKIKGLYDFINEGVYDPGKLKAVFMAGGAGSGKSYTATELFAIDRKTMARTAASGLKVINFDDVLEFLAKKDGMDLRKMHEWTPEETGKYWARSQKRINIIKKTLTAGRLGLLIDSTASVVSRIQNQKEELEALGYDCYMIFVDTSLETALERNRNRERVLADEKVENNWHKVQEAKDELATIFAPNFIVVSTDEGQDVGKQGQKTVDRWLREPIENPIGQQWVQNALELRRLSNGKV